MFRKQCWQFKSGTFTNGERRVQRVNEVIPPIAGTKTDGQNRPGHPRFGRDSGKSNCLWRQTGRLAEHD